MEYIQKSIYIIGDIHGEWDKLKQLIKKYGIFDCTLISVGDIGIGFSRTKKKEYHVHKSLNEFFKHKGISFLGIRGNHDDPQYFDGEGEHENFKLLKDYTRLYIGEQSFLFAGGAISVDRKGKHRKQGSSWWHDETFVLDESKAIKSDVLITHSSPSWIGPCTKDGIVEWTKRDQTLWAECVHERKQHDRLYELVQPSYHYCGHFHESYFTTMNGSVSRVLTILEIKQHL